METELLSLLLACKVDSRCVLVISAIFSLCSTRAALVVALQVIKTHCVQFHYHGANVCHWKVCWSFFPLRVGKKQGYLALISPLLSFCFFPCRVDMSRRDSWRPSKSWTSPRWVVDSPPPQRVPGWSEKSRQTFGRLESRGAAAVVSSSQCNFFQGVWSVTTMQPCTSDSFHATAIQW